jgi:hypothetical protein
LSFGGETLTQALELGEGDPVRAIALLREVLSDPAFTAEVVRVKGEYNHRRPHPKNCPSFCRNREAPEAHWGLHRGHQRPVLTSASPTTPRSWALQLKAPQLDAQSSSRPRAIGATTVRAVLVNYLPLVEAYLQPEDDEFEEDLDRPARPPTDPALPLKRSVTQILREVSVITTRRILERVAVHYVTDRMAWKLLKGDLPAVVFEHSVFLSLVSRSVFVHSINVGLQFVVKGFLMLLYATTA